MTYRPTAFAIPGDITTLTGGYIYERRLLLGLRDHGHPVEHIELAPSFPDASLQEMRETIERLSNLDPAHVLILDGLVFGALEGLEAIKAPVLAMVHHPLALETGLSAARRAHLFETERRNLQVARHVLVPSPHTASVLRSQYGVAPDKITVALPGTDRPTMPSAPTDPPLILSVGLQHPRKGHDVLLKSLAQLLDLPWQSVIVGRAHDRDYAAILAQMIVELGLSGRVRLAGTVSKTELQTYYSQATVFALATRYEGYGIVFDEALSWGLPIVACNAGAVPDTVPNAAGRLVPPDRPDAFGEALRALLTDAPLRAQFAQGAAKAGAALPSWADTARVASGAIEVMT